MDGGCSFTNFCCDGGGQARGLDGGGGGEARWGCCDVLKDSFIAGVGFGDDEYEGEQPDELIDEVGLGDGR